MSPHEYDERRYGADDQVITRVLEAGAPPMRYDLAGIEAAGRTRVRRRRTAYGVLGTATVAALAAATLTVGPLRSAPPNLTPATGASSTASVTPTPPHDPDPDEPLATPDPGVPRALQIPEQSVVSPDGRACGRLPENLRAPLSKAGDQAGLKLTGRWADGFSPVGAATSTQGVVEVRLDDHGEERRLRLVDLMTGAVGPVVAEARVQQSVWGRWDGRLAVYARGVMVGVEVFLWDSTTGRVTLIGAHDDQGWGPAAFASAPAVGSNVAIWQEGHDGPRGLGTFDGRYRLVRYHLDSGRLDILAESKLMPVGILGTDLWAVDGDRLLRVADLGSGTPTVVATGIRVPTQVSSDGRSVAWVDGDRLMVVDAPGRAPRQVRRLTDARDAYPTVGGGLISVAQSYASVGLVSVVIDAETGAATRLRYPAQSWLGRLVVPASAEKFLSAINVADAEAVRAALAAACR
jgi:hypothetical protein